MGNRQAREKKLKVFVHENMAAIDADIRTELQVGTQILKITKTDREDFVYSNDFWNMRAIRENVKL